MSSIEMMGMACDFCTMPAAIGSVYAPLGSRRGVDVWVCSTCGLVQSLAKVVPDGKIRSLSSDADWGNVRHGKGVRFGLLRSIMERNIDWRTVRRVVDVGSNRGDFILWAHESYPQVEIWGVEPDVSVTDRYRSLDGIVLLLNRLEHIVLPEHGFDLVFCSHTLEHATSAADMLLRMHRALRPKGWLVLETPNLAAIAQQDIVEEFFIDKHSFHFDRETLVDFVHQCGFSIIQDEHDRDPMNITLLMERSGEWQEDYVPSDGPERALRNRRWFDGYRTRLSENRLLLKRMVDEKLRPLAKRQKVAYWGAGRIFDALVKYGGLRPDDVFCLVDRFLYGIVNETQGVPIYKPERLRLKEPHVIVILGNSAEQAMAQAAYALGVRHVVKFSELMEQIRDVPSNEPDLFVPSESVVWHHATVTRLRREEQAGHRSVILWFTGLSGAGKSTLAHAVEEHLHQLGCRTFVFDGDNVRHGLCADLTFSVADRVENIRRIGEMTRLFIEAGVIALTAFISPFRSDRQRVRSLVPEGDFIEIYCRCPIEVCEQRDIKGLYKRARAGEILDFTGISSPYEEPEHPELVIDTARMSLKISVGTVLEMLRGRGILGSDHD